MGEAWSSRDKTLFYLLLATGIGLMLLALVLSFTLPLPTRLRFDVVGVVGILGAAVGRFSRKFKRPS